MNSKGHFITWIIFFIPFSISYYYSNGLNSSNFAIMLLGFFLFFLVNPDDDIPLTDGKAHRWFFTHSCLYPIFWYFIFRIIMIMEYAKLVGILFFLPAILHLIGDYRIDHLIGKRSSKWKISFYPLHKRLSKKSTFIWILINEIIMVIYIIIFI